jgi:hypothetical protein
VFAITQLTFWKLKNALRTLFSDPRKYVPLAILFGCVSAPVIITTIGFSSLPSQPRFQVDPSLLPAIVFLTMAALSAMAIDTGLGEGLLAFGMSDVDYLFPSPISRKVVLAYRLPGLTLGALGTSLFVIYIFRIATLMIGASYGFENRPVPPWWVVPLAIAVCVGTYLNVALFIAIQFRNRKTWHRGLISLFLAAFAALGVACWFGGTAAFVRILANRELHWAFYPAWLVAQTMNGALTRDVDYSLVARLGAGYLASLIPLFATHANYYEQSISISERASSLRSAAKGGFASLMASKAATRKYKVSRTYIVPPFGQGASALFWAHLSAAAKRPFVNFALPAGLGALAGSLSLIVNSHESMIGLIALAFLCLYASIGFLASAKTAAEAAIRRREWITPLPIVGRRLVLANLGVPILSSGCFAVSAGVAYSIARGDLWPVALYALGIFYPIRLAGRMTLQYVVVLAYPDFSDRVQQVLGSAVYYLLALPLFIVEVLVCLPAIFLHSFFLGGACLTVTDGAILIGVVILAGHASDRALATGEPLQIRALLVSDKPGPFQPSKDLHPLE